ncbi:TPM domain-containing protein [Aquabacter cavernae]|uniref:TPM domain-containing protein n=1 Tax=Aquabacter cavernae TaxID=2496029 RepID=UPI000F8EE95A|nr:DUF5130 family protein [Aquabacter cavernae]
MTARPTLQARRRTASPAVLRGFGVWLAALVLLFASLPAAADLTFPPLSGRVVDAAHVLDWDTLVALDRKLAAQEAKASDQFVVATVPSLQGTSIEDYANQLFRHWKLGQAKKNNGILLLVAPNERKVRIEVGYGLEGVITDAVAGTIIRTAVVPSFKAGDMAAGVVKGADAVIEILNLDPEEARRRAEALDQGEDPDAWILGIIFLIMLVIFLIIIFRGGGRRTRRRGGAIAFPTSGGGWSSGSSGGGFSGGGGSSGGGGASGGW